DIDGDIKSVVVLTDFYMPSSSLYGPVQQVSAYRQGNQVIVTWEPVWMTEDDDRGYLMEVYLCQNGAYFWDAVHTDKTTYTFTDDPGCAGQSGGLLYVVEKHGYTTPVKIPWPAH
ncbi:MAG: hypothetical protein OEZ02_08145, partial [Anaerolineae bacterium]|nr:hypothetical protein [Anaerolineae bacterium]